MSRLNKYLNVDIVAILRPIMKLNTIIYQSDFEHDMELFIKAANSVDEEDKFLLWMSRTCGTECFYERDAYIKESYAHIAWIYQAETSSVITYAVEITGMQEGKVMGNLFQLDRRKHAVQMDKVALPAKKIIIQFEDGTECTCLYDTYKDQVRSLERRHGKIKGHYLEPESNDELKSLLKAIRKERRAQKYCNE